MNPPPNKSSCDWVSPNTLQPWARNPKDHSAENTNDLARSIVRFGFTDPIEVWRSKQQIVSGHGRLMAVNLLLAEDPGRVLAIDAPEPGQVLVRWLEFASQDEADAYALAANRHNERNPMNADKVAEIFADFEERGVSLEGIGYSDEEREAMLAPLPSDDEWGAATGGLPEGDRAPIQQMTFTLHDEQAAVVKAAIEHAKGLGPFVDTGNENSNGNALARVCEMFGGAR